MLLRDFKPADFDAVVALNVHATDPDAKVADSTRFNPDLLDIPVYYQASGAFLVGEGEGQIIAMGGVVPINDRNFVMTRIRVAIPHQRRGLARALIHELERRAKLRGGTTITLDTTDKQIPAQRLYESLAYVHTHNSVLRNEFGVFNLVHYRKEL
jgi:ribosomal protein S18 acetylase RimI-like enzyme